MKKRNVFIIVIVNAIFLLGVYYVLGTLNPLETIQRGAIAFIFVIVNIMLTLGLGLDVFD